MVTLAFHHNLDLRIAGDVGQAEGDQQVLHALAAPLMHHELTLRRV